MWAVNDDGLRNMFTLQMLAASPEHKRGGYPRIDLEMMREYSAGIVVSTGCPSGEISTRFRLGQDAEAYSYAQALINIYGVENVFVEVMNHSMSSDLERSLLVKQVALAKDLGLRLLATNDCHYALPQDAPHHEEMLAIGTGSTMNDLPKEQGGRRFCFDGDQYYLKSADEMMRLFPDAEYPGAVTNTAELAAKWKDSRCLSTGLICVLCHSSRRTRPRKATCVGQLRRSLMSSSTMTGISILWCWSVLRKSLML